MLILMLHDHTAEQIRAVTDKVRGLGFQPHVIPGEHSVAIGITGNQKSPDRNLFLTLPGVADAIPVSKSYKLASRDFKKADTLIQVKNVTIGAGHFVVMGGPCAVESEEQTVRIARKVKKCGADILRGGAFKPRSSPYAFQGLGLEGLKILKIASQETGLPVITEALDPKSLELVYQYADIIQIGTRNMQNFTLLQEVGRLDKPVMLKRGFSSTIEEWMLAAEYILTGGNDKLMLCERGIRSFDSQMRNLVDLCAVPTVKELSHLPIVVDPSHGTGRRDKVAPISKGAIAVGADAVIIDVHDRPEEALCDGPQALSPDEFGKLVESLRLLAKALHVNMSDAQGGLK